MRCEQYKNIFDAYIDGTVTPQQKRQLEAHIETCAECRRIYQTHCRMETVLSECYTLPGPSEDTIQSILTTDANPESTAKTVPVLAIGLFGKIAAGILVIAAVGFGFMAGRFLPTSSSIDAAPTTYQIQAIEETVLVRHPGSDTWRPLTKDSTIYVGDEFLSTPKAKAIFAVGKESFITLSENSMLVLKTVGVTTELYLANGSLDAALESPHGPFFVTTPHGRAEALGTEFTINVE